MEISPKLKNILEWAYCILIAVGLALIFRYYIGTPTVVKMSSMKNTLIEGDRLILSRIKRGKATTYKRGDIITFEAPTSARPSSLDLNNKNPKAVYKNEPKGFFAKFSYYVLELGKTSYIKRVIGVAGDHVKIENGIVYVNEQELNEPYLLKANSTTSKALTDIIVPEGYVFAMGDNRENSTDCREFGCIPVEKIESKVVMRFWPLNKFGKIEK